MDVTANDVIEFWYSERIKKQWFASSPELDNEILQNYEQCWQQALAGELDHWGETAEGVLALIIVLDQLPLNMFRGTARSFQSEAKSIEIAHDAIAKQFDQQLEKQQLAFLLMPFMHSEKLDDQDLSVALFEEHGLDNNLRFARHHRDIIRRFGRFPHRNEILGRDSSEEELKYLNSAEAFKG